MASLKGNLLITMLLAGIVGATTAAMGIATCHSLAGKAASLLPDVLLATALAVTLRGFAGGLFAATAIELGVVMAGCLAVWLLCISAPATLAMAWKLDAAHVAVQGGLLIALLPLMRRAWLRADLVRLAANAQEPAVWAR